jgi:hypothetical protein
MPWPLLQPVYDRFTEGFEAADLKAAKALLDALQEWVSYVRFRRNLVVRTRSGEEPESTHGGLSLGCVARLSPSSFTGEPRFGL